MLFSMPQSNTENEWVDLTLNLAPAEMSGYQVCASASPGCISGSLDTAGVNASSIIQKARISRTRFFFEEREEFQKQIVEELRAFVDKCDKDMTKPSVRMNGTSDIVWENAWPEIFDLFPSIQFHDYTKHYRRCLPDWKLPNNYHLTFSRSENNEDECEEVLSAGLCNVAVLFDRKFVEGSKFLGRDCINGDVSDLRFLDKMSGSIVWLQAKGRARDDTSGFVVRFL